EEGLLVYGFGERKTPGPFVSACDKFIYTELLRSSKSHPAAAAPSEVLVPSRASPTAKRSAAGAGSSSSNGAGASDGAGAASRSGAANGGNTTQAQGRQRSPVPNESTPRESGIPAGSSGASSSTSPA